MVVVKSLKAILNRLPKIVDFADGLETDTHCDPCRRRVGSGHDTGKRTNAARETALLGAGAAFLQKFTS